MNNSLSEKLRHQIYNFTNMTHRQHHHGDSRANDLNIGRGQGHLLGILLSHDGLTQKELSTQLQIRPASLGELVDKLERSGYVERRVNENDKRVSNVFLKEEGRKLVNEIVISRNSEVDNMFSCLSEEEKNQLSTIMDKLMDSIKENSTDSTDNLDDQDMSSHKHHRMGKLL
ncbi:MAG TPA: MarR family transcriptional regulator [Clostridium sp.]|uniref:MarR family winged helix-turn-helix transcriptional regulator n=1 Tax=Clostridium sp. TaxID=1506 RepID=UPI002F931246